MRSIDILLIEDNEGDILLTKEAFEATKVSHNILVMKDGRLAIDYFKAITENDKVPQIILLDINLPKVKGHEVLLFMKGHEKYKGIPVIMLTTSSLEEDIMLAYKHNANCYITKPIDISDFMKAIAGLVNFWIDIVSLPHKKLHGH